ncbi:MAG: hypothetical protein D6796_00320, partial [Caldilineae bacterium]
MPIFKRRVLFLLFFALLWLAAAPRWNAPARADGPPPDLACRLCHGDMQREYTFPGGETMPLQVPLDALDASPHNDGASVACFNCHRSQARYRFPHQPNPAQNRREFVSEIARNCQGCHAPHNPLHETRQPNPDLPN